MTAILKTENNGEPGAAGRETIWARVDKGARDGLKPGMSLSAKAHGVLVESVEEGTAIVRFAGLSNPPFRAGDPPRVGDELRSRLRGPFP